MSGEKDRHRQLYRERDGQRTDWLGEGDSGNGAVITINKQHSSYLDGTGLTDLPQMNEQPKDFVERSEFAYTVSTIYIYKFTFFFSQMLC